MEKHKENLDPSNYFFGVGNEQILPLCDCSHESLYIDIAGILKSDNAEFHLL